MVDLRRRKGLAMILGGVSTLALRAPCDPAEAAEAVTTAIVPFETSAFPYRGDIPDQNKPFLDVEIDGRLAHTSPRGGRHFEDTTYSSRDVLIGVPKRLDLKRPVAIVVYFHGNQARLGRDVRDRQRVPAQVAASGINAVLVAPQFAVDALDSSAGQFWSRGHFARFLDEAAAQTATVLRDPAAARLLARAPVILVAYSGGYLPAAFSLERGGAGERIAGVVLLDGIYGEEQRFADWISRRGRAFFFSAHSASTRSSNADLMRLVAERHVTMGQGLPKPIVPGGVNFAATGAEVTHQDFMTRAWTADPLAAVLAQVRDFRR